MGVFDSILTFIEGIKSVIDVSGVIQSTITDSISDGIERAFLRIKKPLERSLMRISFISVSLFFLVWGVALFIDNFAPYPGIGFIVVGAFSGIMVWLFLKEKETG